MQTKSLSLGLSPPSVHVLQRLVKSFAAVQIKQVMTQPKTKAEADFLKSSSLQKPPSSVKCVSHTKDMCVSELFGANQEIGGSFLSSALKKGFMFSGPGTDTRET